MCAPMHAALKTWIICCYYQHFNACQHPMPLVSLLSSQSQCRNEILCMGYCVCIQKCKIYTVINQNTYNPTFKKRRSPLGHRDATLSQHLLSIQDYIISCTIHWTIEVQQYHNICSPTKQSNDECCNVLSLCMFFLGKKNKLTTPTMIISGNDHCVFLYF